MVESFTELIKSPINLLYFDKTSCKLFYSYLLNNITFVKFLCSISLLRLYLVFDNLLFLLVTRLNVAQ